MKSWFGLGGSSPKPASPKPANDEAHAGELLAAAEGTLNRLRLGQPSEQSFALLNEAQVGSLCDLLPRRAAGGRHL